jgi:dipeptidyl aminopeptidase/acylaminoacyl peptidase
MKPRPAWPVAVPVLLVLAGTAAPGPDRAAPQAPLDRLLDTLVATHTFHEVALSPDGGRLAWVEGLRRKDGAATGSSAVYVAALGAAAGPPRRITAGDGAAHAEHGLAWSPDSRRLAFLSDRDKPGQLQLYVAPVASGPVARLTDLTGFLTGPRWSPDGKQLAFLFTANAARAAGPVQPGTPEVGVIGEQLDVQRLMVLPTEQGRPQPASPADLYVYEYDWSPDSKHFAAIAATPPGDNNWYIARLYQLSAATAEAQLLLKPDMQIAVPRWSPDGKTIAFISGLMSDEGATGGEIFTIPSAGGKPRNRTPGLRTSASWLAWLPDSDRLLFAEHVDGGTGLATVELDGGRISPLWRGDETISAGAWAPAVAPSRDGKICALIRHSFRQPPEVWAGPVGAWKQVTRANQDARPGWGKAQSLHWKSDGWNVQGWLLYPRHYDPARRYPLVVSVHGGPAVARRPAWPGTFFDPAVLAHEGYFVFFPNPRGSYGQGEAFTRANVKDFGHGDLRDILTGVDAVLKAAPVDPERLGIAGWSYGGYMTMWAVTQTGRFRAAVAGAGIANWQSYYGQNGIDQWLLPYFGATVYDDPAVYARSSPINFVKRVRTPTLLLVGERDLECPAMQSREFWHALRTLKVDTRLVVYPGEGHLIADPQHRRDIMRRTAAWLDQTLRVGSPSSQRPKGP